MKRGIMIGKIIDDLNELQSKVDLRCKLGLTDLNIFCEDFFKQILNLTFDLNLINLNTKKNNFPGIDLGDKRKKIGFQVTSRNDKEKVKDTIKKIINPKHNVFEEYRIIKILIIGDRKREYVFNEKEFNENYSELKFDEKVDIIDIIQLCKEIFSIDYEKLFDIYKLFEREFQKVIYEFEIPDKKGNYPTSLFDKLEIRPNTMCKNGKIFLKDNTNFSITDLENVYKKFAQLPRVTREFVAILVELGESEEEENYTIRYLELIRKLEKQGKENIKEEIYILQSREIISDISEDDIDHTFYTKFSSCATRLFHYSQRNECLRKIIVAMDFTILDS